MKLLYLQSENRRKDIHFYINSPGGERGRHAGDLRHDADSDCPVGTYCVGLAASGAAVLLAGGTKGKRFALPHAKVMIHQPYGRSAARSRDIEIQAEEILTTPRGAQRDPGQAHRPADRADRQGHRPRLLHRRRRPRNTAWSTTCCRNAAASEDEDKTSCRRIRSTTAWPSSFGWTAS